MNFNLKKGIIKDTNPFLEENERGLYFTDIENLIYWYDYLYYGKYTHIYEVEIVQNEEVIKYERKYKSKKINIVSEIRHISELEIWNNYQECLRLVKIYGCTLQFVNKDILNEEICLEAVNQNEYAIQYVPKNISNYSELCKQALKRQEKHLKPISDYIL